MPPDSDMRLSMAERDIQALGSAVRDLTEEMHKLVVSITEQQSQQRSLEPAIGRAFTQIEVLTNKVESLTTLVQDVERKRMQAVIDSLEKEQERTKQEERKRVWDIIKLIMVGIGSSIAAVASHAVWVK